ncbi:S9 family peptidase [Sporolactobacillus terrae]|uniref:S9 family peptidase n=1 Tax=Sporolactobacillus terrae TaxID=269673 RepID=A0ABX5Q614_9BACL|nr:S9 family peptidase [Sporolactobacillus terrae]QAA22078.1 S9 family peptidase [Sporolactobacillus terrae]QAA25050.1 S9 family peptidase [Sporolactobacillus terrae]UAK16873.1 S9 family peptidase [Sporolactobacillus terrae]
MTENQGGKRVTEATIQHRTIFVRFLLFQTKNADLPFLITYNEQKGGNILNKRLIAVEDLAQFTFAGNPVLSPDGTTAVYVVTKTDLHQNGYVSTLYITNDEQAPRPLTHAYQTDRLIKHHRPSFSADGTYVYYLSNQTGTDQVWRIRLSGGESEQVTKFEHGVEDYVLSPDRMHMVCRAINKDRQESENDDVTVITRLRYLQNGKGFVDQTGVLYFCSIKRKQQTRITKPNCDAKMPRFSLDGHTLYFLMTKSAPETSDFLFDVYSYHLSTETTTCIYQANGTLYDLAVSPDGRTVALAGTEDGEFSPKNIELLLLPSHGGTVHHITEHWNLSLGNFVSTDARFDAGNSLIAWTEDSQALICLVQDGAISGLKTVHLDGSCTTLFMKEKHVVTSFAMQNNVIAAIISTPLSTGELYFLGNNDSIRQNSFHNQSLFNQLDLNEPIAFTYKGADDWTIDGWVLLPPTRARKTGKIPIVLEIHGGPASAYGDSFHHEFQCLAAEGYAVVYTNPRGSRGYGSAFCAGCFNDWGRKDKEDILKGLDYVLDHFPECDRTHQYVTGGSYGGFMTNTIVGTTNRFRAAVTQRSICNLYNFYGTSDIGYYFLKRYFNGADLWDAEERLMQFSPIRNAPRVKTPICIIHSEQDHRCPIEQAEQWYVALRRLGVPARFVRINGENHELSRSGRPQNRFTRLHELINWFNRYCPKETSD